MCVCNIVVENKMKFHLKKYVLKKKKAFSSPVTIIIYLFFFFFCSNIHVCIKTKQIKKEAFRF